MIGNYLLAVGYSIGITQYNNEFVAVVDMADKSVILDVKSFSAWQLIFQCVDIETYLSKYNEIYNDNEGEKILDDLISSEIVLKLNINTPFKEQYEILKEYKLCRQGMGIGIGEGDINKYIVVTDKKIMLDSAEFTVWASANTVLKVEDIYNSFEGRIDEQVLISILLNLYHENIIYLVR